MAGSPSEGRDISWKSCFPHVFRPRPAGGARFPLKLRELKETPYTG